MSKKFLFVVAVAVPVFACGQSEGPETTEDESSRTVSSQDVASGLANVQVSLACLTRSSLLEDGTYNYTLDVDVENNGDVAGTYNLYSLDSWYDAAGLSILGMQSSETIPITARGVSHFQRTWNTEQGFLNEWHVKIAPSTPGFFGSDDASMIRVEGMFDYVSGAVAPGEITACRNFLANP